MLDVCIIRRFCTTERHVCHGCNLANDKFYFQCRLSDGSKVTFCGTCLYAMSKDKDSFQVQNSSDAEGIGDSGIQRFLCSQYGEVQFSDDWEIARAILLPHHETNQQEKPKGEWIFTAIVDKNGNVLEEDRQKNSMGIYPNKSVAEEEISRYIKSRGAKTITFEYVSVYPDCVFRLIAPPYSD